MKKIIVAIDGYSACGKSTTARKVAENLGYAYIDSGAMYRAVTLYFLDNHISLTNEKAVVKALGEIDIHFENIDGSNTTFLNGLNVERRIRTMHVNENVSEVSTLAVVRNAMVEQQRRMGRKRGVVMDGRDIGTVVFPDAELKVFMTADMDVRAGRRQLELLQKKQTLNLDDIKNNLAKRDQIDTTRKESPLRKAQEAIEVDTSDMTLDEQVEQVASLARERIMEKA